MVELHREGSAPAACAAGLFSNDQAIDPWFQRIEKNIYHYVVVVVAVPVVVVVQYESYGDPAQPESQGGEGEQPDIGDLVGGGGGTMGYDRL